METIQNISIALGALVAVGTMFGFANKANKVRIDYLEKLMERGFAALQQDLNEVKNQSNDLLKEVYLIKGALMASDVIKDYTVSPSGPKMASPTEGVAEENLAEEMVLLNS